VQAFDTISGIGTPHSAPTYRTNGTVEIMHLLLNMLLVGGRAVRVDDFAYIIRNFFKRDLVLKRMQLAEWTAKAAAVSEGREPKGPYDPMVRAMARYRRSACSTTQCRQPRGHAGPGSVCLICAG
jgi:hypothetical protein